MNPEKLISIDQLGARLGGLSRASIYRHIKSVEGFPQPLKIGSLTRFSDKDVDEFLFRMSRANGRPENVE